MRNAERGVWNVLVGLALAAGSAHAQAHPQCQSPFADVQRACNGAVDAYRALQPLVGVATSGGNPVLGSAAPLGGLGHAFVTGRLNLVRTVLPNPDTTMRPVTGTIPAPVVEAGIGVARGLPSGLLAFDVLASALLLPTSLEKLTVESDAARVGDMALGIGYGARVGILQGGLLVPAVSLSAMRRSLPRVRYGDLRAGDDFEFDTDLAATNWRLTAGLRFLVVDVAAGIGLDRYASTAHLRVSDPGAPGGVREVTIEQAESRDLLYLNAGMNFAVLRLVGELGYQTGKDQTLSRTYQGLDPRTGHVFGGIGLRFTF